MPLATLSPHGKTYCGVSQLWSFCQLTGAQVLLPGRFWLTLAEDSRHH